MIMNDGTRNDGKMVNFNRRFSTKNLQVHHLWNHRMLYTYITSLSGNITIVHII